MAFQEGKWVNENITLAYEVADKMNKTNSEKGWVGIKIDFWNASDRVEWSFIRAILIKIGFHEKFV